MFFCFVMPQKTLPKKLEEVVKRYEENPILSKEDIPFACSFIFNTGVVQETNGEVKIYYGAADTSICLATAKISDLIEIAEKY